MSSIVHLIATYGYVVLFLVVMAESAGVPLPGETSLLVAGALAASGKLALPGVLAAAALGAIVGDTVGYWVGRTSGLQLLRRHGRLVHFDEQRLAQAEQFFTKHGDKAVFIGRFVPVGRMFSAVLAGVSRMSYARFLLWNAAGCITWAVAMGSLGYLFSQQLPRIERIVTQGGLLLLAALVVLAVLWFVVRHRLAHPGRRANQQHQATGRGRFGFSAIVAPITDAVHTFAEWRYRWHALACCTGIAVVGGALVASIV